MKNFIQHGDIITCPAPTGGCLSGELYKVADVIGVAVASQTVDGADVELKVSGVFELAKTSAQAWTVGQKLYMIPGTRVVTSAATAGNFVIGYATAVAANPSATGYVRLNGVGAPAAV